MKKIYIVSEESNSLYKGGISSIVDSYFLNQPIFNSFGYSLVRINPLTFKISKNPFVRKIINVFRIRSEQKKVFRSIDKNGDCVVHIHSGYGFVLLKSLLICKYLKKKGIKHVVLSVHFADFKNIFSKHTSVNRFEQKLAKKYVDKIILLSKNTKKEFLEHGFVENKLSVLYTFHSYGKSDLELVYKQKFEEPIQLLFVGSIDKRKGVIDLLNALAITDNKNIKITFCGSNNDQKIYDLFKKSVDSSKNINYVGYVQGEEKVNIFKQSDVLVLPSYGEGLPIVIMEALHYGCGIISTCVGSIPEILADKENCYFFNPGDIKQLVNILNALNHNAINEMKIKNIELSNKFTCQNNIEQLCSIYGELYE